jgi:ribosomal-protein-alanine N-acetyltransferase
MTQVDVPEVSRVERRCFGNPWPASAYRRELRNPGQNFYILLRGQPEDGPEGIGDAAPESATHRPGDGLRSLARLPLLHRTRRSGGIPDGPHVAGFAGMWTVYDEAHITTIGVDPVYRGRGFGELLLLALFDEAVRRGSTWITLEVRVSNHAALALYQKYGMNVRGTRKRYYSDNGEDAYVMWSRSLRDEEYLAELDDLRLRLRRRLGPEVEVPEPPGSLWRTP